MNDGSLLVALTLCAIARVASIGFVVWFDAYYPAVADRVFETYCANTRRNVLLGAFNAVAWAVVILLLFATQVLALLGVGVLACMIGASAIGFAAAYRRLGERLSEGGGRSRIRTLIYGAVCLEAAFFTPLIGQALAFGVFLRAFGAVITTFLAMRRDRGVTLDAASPLVPSSDADASS